MHQKSGELDSSQLSSSSSLSNSVLFFPLPFLAVTATAELKEGPSSDTLAAGFWSINDQIGLVTMFASGLVAFFALVNLAAGFDVEGFAAGLLSSLAIIFFNASNPDDLMAGSSMSPRISLDYCFSH